MSATRRFERFDDDPRAAQAFLDVYDLIPAHGEDDEWILTLSVAGGAPQQLTARQGVGGSERLVAGNRNGLFRMRATVNKDEVPLVRCRRLADHAEVERVDVEDAAFAITGTVRTRQGDVTLVATSRRDGTELRSPVERDGEAFSAQHRAVGPGPRGRFRGLGPAPRRR